MMKNGKKYVIKDLKGIVKGYIHVHEIEYTNGIVTEFDVVPCCSVFACAIERTLSKAKEKVYQQICPKNLCTITKS